MVIKKLRLPYLMLKNILFREAVRISDHRQADLKGNRIVQNTKGIEQLRKFPLLQPLPNMLNKTRAHAQNGIVMADAESGLRWRQLRSEACHLGSFS